MESPTFNDSMDRTNSLGSLIDQNEYNSLSSENSSPTLSNNKCAADIKSSPLVSSLLTNVLLSNNDSGGGSSCSSGISSTGSSCSEGSNSGSSGTLQGAVESANESSSSSSSGNVCGLCRGPFKQPRVLACFHTFCEACLERNQEHAGKITCFHCRQECIVPSAGVSSLLPDPTVNDSGRGSSSSIHDELCQAAAAPPLWPSITSSAISSISTSTSSTATIMNASSSSASSSSSYICTHCTSAAGARCIDCSKYVCQDCKSMHENQPMNQFDTVIQHRVYNLSSPSSSNNNVSTNSPPRTTSPVTNGSDHPLCGSLVNGVLNDFNGGGIDDFSNYMSTNGLSSGSTRSSSSASSMKNGGGSGNNDFSSSIGAAAAAGFCFSSSITSSPDKKVPCQRHKTDFLEYYCFSCNIPICQECNLSEHSINMHEIQPLAEVSGRLVSQVFQIVGESREKVVDMNCAIDVLDFSSEQLDANHQKAVTEMNETLKVYHNMIDEHRAEMMKELDHIYATKKNLIKRVASNAREVIKNFNGTSDFMEKLKHTASATECLMFKKLFETKVQTLLSIIPDITTPYPFDLEFVSNYQTIQSAIRSNFGYIKSNGDIVIGTGKQPPIARPNGFNSSCNGFGPSNGSSSSSSPFTMNGGNGANGYLNSNGHGLLAHHQQDDQLGGVHNGIGSNTNNGGYLFNGGSTLLDGKAHSAFVNGGNVLCGLDNVGSGLDSYDPLSKRYVNGNRSSTIINGGLGFFANNNDMNVGGSSIINSSAPSIIGNGSNNIAGYEKWSNGGGDIFQNSNDFATSLNNGTMNGDMLDIGAKMINNVGASSSVYPPKSQIKRQKMIYHCKFGEFGALEGQFTEPSGVAVNAQNDIIVADTNNHRIQIFDKEGRFRFQFGECGKRDGQLLYPNRVAVVKMTGDIIVTERSPTHQIQIYNQYGHFLRKFGATILQHPRGITVDNQGRIVVVECKVMRVIIFDQGGSVLQKFGCSKHLEFPNGVVVNDNQEIFISDNRAHCVKVFNYEGNFLRQIGSEGITNYPIGVGINAAGDILIADNHNNFNLTIFTQEGHLKSALESKVKHAQCFDVALMDEGSVVLASKDYRLYIYRYLQITSVGI